MVVLTCSVRAVTLPTTDYLYATALQYDDDEGMWYFDVYLEGTKIYTAYGIDIQLPEGLEGASDRGKPVIYILDDYYLDKDEVIYPKAGRRYYHTVSSSFPHSGNLTHMRVACIGENEDFVATSGGLFRVYVNKTCTATQWPVGGIKLYAVELNQVGQPYSSPEKTTAVVMYDGESTLPLSVSASNHWSTCILPFAAAIPQGVKAYVSTSASEDKVFLNEITEIEAFTPYVLYSENGYSGTVSGVANATACPLEGSVTAGNLKGTLVGQGITDGYVLQNQDDVVMFYAVEPNSTFNMPAGKCWLDIASGANANSRMIVVGNTSGISNIATVGSDGHIYNLQGMKESKPVRGNIYIKNGKKFSISK